MDRERRNKKIILGIDWPLMSLKASAGASPPLYRETSRKDLCVFQCVPVAIQRGNAVSSMSTFDSR